MQVADHTPDQGSSAEHVHEETAESPVQVQTDGDNELSLSESTRDVYGPEWLGIGA